MTLTELIAQGEGLRLEFKSKLPAAPKIARTLAAFANTSGGTLLVGVADNGSLVGVESEFDEMEKIERVTESLIHPPLDVSYRAHRQQGKTVLWLTITESQQKPHTVPNDRGGRTIYVRQRDKSVPTNHFNHPSQPLDPQLLKTPPVKQLLAFLQKNDSLTADRCATLVNVSAYRAGKLLRELAAQGVLLLVDSPRPARYSLK